MAQAVLLAILSVVILFLPIQISDNFRIVIMLGLVILSFTRYLFYKFEYWSKSGKDSKIVLLSKIIGLLTSAIAGFSGGIISGLVSNIIGPVDFSRPFIEATFGTLVGILLGTAAGISTSKQKHILSAAVTGGCSGVVGGVMGGLFPYVSTATLLILMLSGGITGASVGYLLGKNTLQINQFILERFPGLHDMDS